MKSITLVGLLSVVVLLGSVCSTVWAADTPAPSKWEYAILKWDAPDRIYYNLPDKFELVHLSQIGVVVPKEAQREEWCLAWAVNKMSEEGWEAVNLNSRRVLMRRVKAK